MPQTFLVSCQFNQVLTS